MGISKSTKSCHRLSNFVKFVVVTGSYWRNFNYEESMFLKNGLHPQKLQKNNKYWWKERITKTAYLGNSNNKAQIHELQSISIAVEYNLNVNENQTTVRFSVCRNEEVTGIESPRYISLLI